MNGKSALDGLKRAKLFLRAQKWVIFTAKKATFNGLYVVVLFVLFLCPIEPPLFIAFFKAIFENCRVEPPPFLAMIRPDVNWSFFV